MENNIEVNNLSKKYDTFELKNINFTVPKGSIVGFVGENGAGKTTTIKSILNITNEYGFSTTQTKLSLYGLCEDCERFMKKK